jgi:glycosyltransferase involved in cell wall biosynthesis
MESDSISNTTMPRVLLSGHLPPPMSGIGTYYESLLASSLPKRVRLQFIDTSSRRRPGAETGTWSLSNMISAISDCARFARIAVLCRPEICHIATSVGLSFLKHSVCIVIARLLGSKVVLHPHCSFYFFYQRRTKSWQWFARKVIGLCHIVIILSNEWKELQEILPSCQLYYLPNAINLSGYVEVGLERLASKNDKFCLHVLYLGHVGKDKGSFDLISAAKKVVGQENRVIFDLVGHEQALGDIKRLNEEVIEAGFEQFIHFQSPVKGAEKIKLFRSADIFVYPSYHEGMPMAVIEAMACGLPIIATQVGGLPDLVFPDVNGLLVPVGQPDRLAAAIQLLIDEPQLRYSMQAGSYRLAQENFDIEKLVIRLLDIYQAVLLPHSKTRIH